MFRTFIFIFFFPVFADAQLQLAKIFSDNMLLQRDYPIHIWGKAIPGKTITVSFIKDVRSAKVKNDSSWSLYLPPQTVKLIPEMLIVSCGSENIVLKNILIGDIWVCIGQSNMEWPVLKEMHYKEEIGKSQQPLLRFFNPTYAGKNIYNTYFNDSILHLLTPEKFYSGKWQSCDSNSIKNMSAVAYYFGKELMEKKGVPIGLINISIGGAPLETFIDKLVLKNSKEFSAKVKNDWLENKNLPVWIRERGKQNVGDLLNVPSDENGKNHGFKPGFAYAAGIEPLLQLPVKGILCYQGESNAQEMERVSEYATLSKILIEDYRKKWRQADLPFYFVQLSSIDTMKYKGHLWPQFRDEQRKMLSIIQNSGMVVCSDIGAKDDVHPINKKTVGERLARWALNKTYQQNIIPSGPLPVRATYSDGKVIILFEYAGLGLKTSNKDKLKGFSLDGKTQIEAEISDGMIIIYTNKKPEYVYYGWKSFSDGNLINSENLPASTFKLLVK